ncbi:MAG: MarR family transcriptional regulator [Microbacteriaceae bacterium]|nr:MarR family transcriptional regulator [Microbacteriaceae bacterium]
MNMPHDADWENELLRAIQKLARRSRNRRGVEIGDSLLAVLFHIDFHPGVSPTELATREHVTPPAMNKTLNALAAQGLVTRAPDASDARRVTIEITDAGRVLLAETRRLRAEWFHEHLGVLTEAEIAALDAALPALRKLADQ